MKKLLLLILLLQISHQLTAQDWMRYYGNGQQPYASYCIEDYDKGYILAGSVNSSKYGWIIKTDINGNELWDIKVGDGINLTGTENIEKTDDHGFILCGSTRIFNPPHSDPFIMKLNKCGELEWCKTLVYDNAGDGAVGVKPTADGGYVLAAFFYGNVPNDRTRMFKFDGAGNLIWYKIYNREPNVHNDQIENMFIDGSNILLTGNCYYTNWIKPYYIQIDTTGKEIWRLIYSEHTGNDFIGEAWTSVKDSHGNYYSGGRRDGSPELIKFTKDGYEMMNTDLFPGAEGGNAVTILIDNDTSLIIGAGWTMNGIDNELAMLKTDTLGNILTVRNLPNPNHSGIDWSSNTTDHKILAVGTDFTGTGSRIELFKFNSDLEYDSIYTKTYTYDSLCPNTIVSHTISLNCGVLVGADDHLTSPETTFLKVFPNPANQKLTVEFPKCLVVKTGLSGFGSTTVYRQWKSTILEIFDLSGKKIFEKEIVRAETFLEIDVSQWPRGIYNFNLQYNKQIVANKKVVVK